MNEKLSSPWYPGRGRLEFSLEEGDTRTSPHGDGCVGCLCPRCRDERQAIEVLQAEVGRLQEALKAPDGTED